MSKRLALTTILTAAPFFAYGRVVQAACTETTATSSIYLCSDPGNPAQAITDDNANVSTLPGFGVGPTAAGTGIAINGKGHLQFHDDNASVITSTLVDEDGLRVISAGDLPGAPGAVTIVTNGKITGQALGINAQNKGSGDIEVTATGEATGVQGMGIYAGNTALGGNVRITTGADSVITGYNFGITGMNKGKGDLEITANGDVIADDRGVVAVYGRNISGAGGDLAITTGLESYLKGAGGIRALNNGSGDTRIDVGGTVNAKHYGIDVGHEGKLLEITTRAGSEILASTYGISARNFGEGDLVIAAAGNITASTGDAIFARNISATGDLEITIAATSTITGKRDGLIAKSEGGRDIEVTVHGEVAGTTRFGLHAYNVAATGDVTAATETGSKVTGYRAGIYASNDGDGQTTVTANGEVRGVFGAGIYARNTTVGGDITITTGADSVIRGHSDGVFGANSGKGDLTITVNGDAIADPGGNAAVYGHGRAGTGDLSIATGAGSYLKGDTGIRALSFGIGDIDVDVGGKVVAADRGIDANNGADGTGQTVRVTTRAGSDIEGKINGILARNFGKGDLIVTIAGNVSASAGDAIVARTIDMPNDLKLTIEATSLVSGEAGGIVATSGGHGKSEITIRGIVVGKQDFGIHAAIAGNSDGLKISTDAGSQVTGRSNGIQAFGENERALDITINGNVRGTIGNGVFGRNYGTGDVITRIGAGGLVEGKLAGIDASSTDGQAIIVNGGLVRNLSGASTDIAITVTGRSTIGNSGALIGTVALAGGSDTLTNDGLWNMTGGVSDFGSADDVVTNRGVFVAAVNPDGPGEITEIRNLETFNNAGLISLVDGRDGDTLKLSSGADFVGGNGKLAVDAFLAPGGAADHLMISGDVSGTTTLAVNLTNPLGSTPDFDGIDVIFVDGATATERVTLEGGVLNAGFFAWDLRLDETGKIHQLYTTGLGAGAYEFAAGITGAQDIWHQTTGMLLQRQADLRPLIAATQVTPVADFAEPVEPTPVSRVTSGFWFKGVGAWVDRDAHKGVLNLDRGQSLWGGLAGFDFGTENVRSQGDALLFGLFGGYFASDLKFHSTDTKWTYEGPSVGVYATYLDHAFYVDATVKADFLEIDIDAEEIAPGAGKADTDAVNIGGQVDTGYKMGLAGGMFIEPQASLSVLYTEIDDIDDIFGGAVAFEDETQARGRLGLRLGHELTASNQVIYSSDVTASLWQSFTGDNDVTVFAPLTPASSVSDDPGRTTGEVSLGFGVVSPEGWSGFLRGNYQFAEDYDAYSAHAGMRYAW